MRVLVVDDDLGRQAQIKSAASGAQIKHALTPAIAIEMLRKEPRFDLVLLDHDLGCLATGEAVADCIIAMDPTARPKRVVVHTLDGPAGMRVAFKLAEAHVWVRRRPFGKDMLARTEDMVKEHLTIEALRS